MKLVSDFILLFGFVNGREVWSCCELVVESLGLVRWAEQGSGRRGGCPMIGGGPARATTKRGWSTWFIGSVGTRLLNSLIIQLIT